MMRSGARPRSSTKDPTMGTAGISPAPNERLSSVKCPPRSNSTSTSTSPRRPMPLWQQVVRRQLGRLSRTALDDPELVCLHISLQEPSDGCAFTASDETQSLIEDFLNSAIFKGRVSSIIEGSKSFPENMLFFSTYINALMTISAAELGGVFSEYGTKFPRYEHKLRITGDSHTKGVSTFLEVQDLEGLTSFAVIIRNPRLKQNTLAASELYTLLTLADKLRIGRPNAHNFRVHVITISHYWVSRISADIPAAYISSIIRGNHEILSSIEVRRTPWVNFLEESGQRGAFLALFEHFPLARSSGLSDSEIETPFQSPPSSPLPEKRAAVDDLESESKRRKE